MVFFNIIGYYTKIGIGKLRKKKYILRFLIMLIITTIIILLAFMWPIVLIISESVAMVYILYKITIDPDNLPKWAYL